MRYLTLLLSLFSITLSAATEEKAKPVIALIPKGSAHVFWKSVESGALKAGEDLG
ncbi:MAG: LacI family transcriptional regulator, partial [Verrucomicrobia bacterium]|nr:LacI family transcriptional regulator [Verrucomicrobiota bacterium]